VFNVTFSNISAISWQPVLVVEKVEVPRGEPPTMGKQLGLAAASDKVYQLLAHGRWFSLGTPVSSTTKTGHHDLTEILLKVALKHQKSIN
jgi:hypothetical protein